MKSSDSRPHWLSILAPWIGGVSGLISGAVIVFYGTLNYASAEIALYMKQNNGDDGGADGMFVALFYGLPSGALIGLVIGLWIGWIFSPE